MSIKEMPFMMQITKEPELKELQQQVTNARERKQLHSAQLDEFQEIGAQLSMKEIFVLKSTQEGKTNIAANMVEHPIDHDLKVSHEVTERVKEKVQAITQQFAYFKAKIVEFTMSD